MCIHPFMAFDTGTLTVNGKSQYCIVQEHFEPGKLLPIWMVVKKGLSVDKSKAPFTVDCGVECLKDPIPIPCGSCWQCVLDKAQTWAVRGVLESKYHRFNYFVTLTYDDAHLRFDSSGSAVLSFKDHQLFMKRFRKLAGVKSVRFLGCGEYGETTGRPHLHYVFFMDRPLALEAFGVNRYHSPALFSCWPFGLHEVSFCQPGCISYVAGYVVKKAKLDVSAYSVPPFRCMSRKPGLGRQYFEDHPEMIDSLKVYGDFGCCSSKPLPRYFKSLLGDEYKAMKDVLKKVADESHKVDQTVYQALTYEDIGYRKSDYIETSVRSKEDKS